MARHPPALSITPTHKRKKADNNFILPSKPVLREVTHAQANPYTLRHGTFFILGRKAGKSLNAGDNIYKICECSQLCRSIFSCFE